MSIPEKYMVDYGRLQGEALDLLQAIVDDNYEDAEFTIYDLDNTDLVDEKRNIQTIYLNALALSFLYNRKDIAELLQEKDITINAIGDAIKEASDKDQVFGNILEFLDDSPELLRLNSIKYGKKDITDKYLPELLMQQISIFPEYWTIARLANLKAYLDKNGKYPDTSRILDIYIDKMQKL